MRLWRRLPDRIGKKGIGPRWRIAQLRWAVSLRPGDVVNTCDLFNHEVRSVDVSWWRHGRRGRVVGWVDVQTDRQTCSALHCGLTPALDEPALLRQLCEHLPVYDEYPGQQSYAVRHLIRLMEQGTSVLDDRRLLKPEFARLVFPS